MFNTRLLQTPKDKELLVSIQKEHFPLFNPDLVSHRSFVAAFDNNELVGLVAFVESSFRMPEAVGIGYICTHVQHRARGVAKALVDRLFTFAAQENKNIANTPYEEDGLKWLKPVMQATAERYPSVQLFER